ncbi:MAG: mannose-1-phosphate guanyltransferase, partial [Thiotrichales bacterium]
MNRIFSIQRFLAILIKEFIQIKRDRMTFAMIIGIPLLQLILFGYAINTNPRHLPSVLLTADHSIFTRDFVYGMKNTKYFKFLKGPHTEKQAAKMLKSGEILFVVNIPANFTKDLIRNHHPKILVTG